ncbi:hypothetical protein KL929_005311 [Ogataea haglerorum]|nr:hypothetical protein KL950_005290 [Ogataea haglerorum]KAG7713539.1 hypothetical protein KL949_005288 [Ogataea haglerorum]KAG7733477.1 hypothetical protein KL932_005258 [Ogataea haglerorum]KAG7735969.1 hypothetical protein KL923_005249 [Ogataea haglerorum]KAG7744791.1 hypothetical protein KL912_005301 [Ogataea haglerorum]
MATSSLGLDDTDDHSISNSVSAVSKRRRRRNGSLRLSKNHAPKPKLLNVWGTLQLNTNPVLQIPKVTNIPLSFVHDDKEQLEPHNSGGPESNLHSSMLKSIMKPSRLVSEEQLGQKTVSFKDEVSVRSNSLGSIQKSASTHVLAAHTNRSYRDSPVRSKLLNNDLFQRPTSKELEQFRTEPSDLEILCFEPEHSTPEDADRTLDSVCDSNKELSQESRKEQEMSKELITDLGGASDQNSVNDVSDIFNHLKTLSGTKEATETNKNCITSDVQEKDVDELDQQIRSLKQKKREIIKRQRQASWFHGGLLGFIRSKNKDDPPSMPSAHTDTHSAIAQAFMESEENRDGTQSRTGEYSNGTICSSDLDTPNSSRRLSIREFFKKRQRTPTKTRASEPIESLLESLQLTPLHVAPESRKSRSESEEEINVFLSRAAGTVAMQSHRS